MQEIQQLPKMIWWLFWSFCSNVRKPLVSKCRTYPFHFCAWNSDEGSKLQYLKPPVTKKNRFSSALIYVVVSNIFDVQPYFGKIPILTNIFQMSWNHHLLICWFWRLLGSDFRWMLLGFAKLISYTVEGRFSCLVMDPRLQKWKTCVCVRFF